MSRLPSLLALRAFDAAARTAGFTAAARELNLSPSAISHQIRSLESYFGRALFIRRGVRVELTDVGAQLARKLSTSFLLIEEACNEVTEHPSDERLSIYCSPSFETKWLAPRLPDFMRQNPAAVVRLSSGTVPADLLHDPELNVAISYLAPPYQPGLITESLGFEDVVALCTPSLAALCDRVGIAGAGAPLIQSTRNPVQWPEWLALNDQPQPDSPPRTSFDRGAMAVSAAIQGLGIALESRRFALHELATSELVELGGGAYQSIKRELHFLTYRKTQIANPAVSAFRTWLYANLSDEPRAAQQ